MVIQTVASVVMLYTAPGISAASKAVRNVGPIDMTDHYAIRKEDR